TWLRIARIGGADVLILTGVHSGGNLLPCLADGFADGVDDEPNAYLRSDTGGRRSVRARRGPARTGRPGEIEGGSAAGRDTRWRRRWRRRARLHRRGHRLERPQLMERRARLAQAGWTSGRGPQGGASGGGPQGGWPCDS